MRVPAFGKFILCECFLWHVYITHINHLIIIIDSIDYAKARAIVIYVDPGDVLSQFIHHMN